MYSIPLLAVYKIPTYTGIEPSAQNLNWNFASSWKHRCSRKGIINKQNIPEVQSYWYLCIIINQTLILYEKEKFLNTNKICLNKRIGILKSSILNTKSTYEIYKLKSISKYSYTVSILCYFNSEYTKKWESIKYWLVKRLFFIKSNISKDSWFKILNIDNISTQINNTINKVKGIKYTSNIKHYNFTENLS